MSHADSFHARLLTEAYRAALCSDHATTRVGAVIADQDGRPVSRACNGFPHGITHSVERVITSELWDYYSLHAEMRALLGWMRQGREGHPQPLTIASTHTPCAACASALVAMIPAGLGTVVLDACLPREESAYPPKWKRSVELGRHLLEEGGMAIHEIPATLSYPDEGDMAGSWWQLKHSFDQAKPSAQNAHSPLGWKYDPCIDWRDDPFMAALMKHFIQTSMPMRDMRVRLPLDMLSGSTALILVDLHVAHVELGTMNPAQHSPEQDFALGLLREAQIPFAYARSLSDIVFKTVETVSL
ncbi:MAG: hypothetical protein IPI58_05360 [Alphaproteobacteria bacterium]|nr:MAG: hypothetical protein IPI58_05360 [Alphaproteobacteria bacterium]